MCRLCLSLREGGGGWGVADLGPVPAHFHHEDAAVPLGKLAARQKVRLVKPWQQRGSVSSMGASEIKVRARVK